MHSKEHAPETDKKENKQRITPIGGHVKCMACGQCLCALLCVRVVSLCRAVPLWSDGSPLSLRQVSAKARDGP